MTGEINPKGVASTANLETATQDFIDGLVAAGGPPIHTLSPANARGVLSSLQSLPVGKPDTRAEDAVLPAGPNGSIRVRLISPREGRAPLPVVIYFHGGGWVLGDASTHDRLIREIATGAQAAVVFIDYNRSPESQFPVPVEEAYAATKYVAENSAAFGVDGSRLAVVGDSVGGNMAAAVTLLCKDRRGPKIGFQVLFYPVTGADFETGSYRTFENGPWLTRQSMQWFWDAYLPDKAARAAITATPVNATIDQLKGLPDALIVTAENDVLRDEGEAYARKLWEAGVRVTCSRYIGTIHDFVMLNAISDTPATRAAIAQAIAVLRTALE